MNDGAGDLAVLLFDSNDLSGALNVLIGRVSQLGTKVETFINTFENRIQHLCARLNNVEKYQSTLFCENECPDTKRTKIDRIQIPLPEQDINYMHSQLTGPVKDAIQTLGRQAVNDHDITLLFLRIGSDKFVRSVFVRSYHA